MLRLQGLLTYLVQDFLINKAKANLAIENRKKEKVIYQVLIIWQPNWELITSNILKNVSLNWILSESSWTALGPYILNRTARRNTGQSPSYGGSKRLECAIKYQKIKNKNKIYWRVISHSEPEKEKDMAFNKCLDYDLFFRLEIIHRYCFRG